MSRDEYLDRPARGGKDFSDKDIECRIALEDEILRLFFQLFGTVANDELINVRNYLLSKF